MVATPKDQPSPGPTPMNDAAAARRPRGPGRRLLGLDAARGLAILGMVIVNVGPTESENLLQRLYLLPFGRASILFVVIAGVGMGYFLRRRRGGTLWWPLSWRVALLFALGVLLQTLTDRVSLILQTYAALFLLAPLLSRLTTRWLFSLGLVLMVAGPAWIVHHGVAEPWGRAVEGISVTTPPGDALESLLVTGPYPLASWTVPFIAGLLLSRLDLHDLRVQRRLLWWGLGAAVVAFVVADVALTLLGVRAEEGYARLLTGVGHGQMPLWLISSIGGAFFAVALCQRLSERASWTVRWLVRCGVLAFTLYVLHVLVLAVIKPADGFTFGQGVLVALALSAGLVAVAQGWARTGRPGPLEWLLRHTWLGAPPPRSAETQASGDNRGR